MGKHFLAGLLIGGIIAFFRLIIGLLAAFGAWYGISGYATMLLAALVYVLAPALLWLYIKPNFNIKNLLAASFGFPAGMIIMTVILAVMSWLRIGVIRFSPVIFYGLVPPESISVLLPYAGLIALQLAVYLIMCKICSRIKNK